MPPKRRGRPARAEAPQPSPSPEPGPEPVADDDDASNHSDQDEDQDSDPDLDPDASQRESDFKFFNTTFSTFRVSPLYMGQNVINEIWLDTLSRRLRDTLVGDVVRGVRVGLENDNTLNRLGVLERVEWRECELESIMPTLKYTERRLPARGRGRDIQGGRGVRRVRRLLCLELEYERATFSALMLPSLDDGNESQNRGATGVGGEDDEDGSSRSRNPPSWTRHTTDYETQPGDSGKGAQDVDNGDERESNAFARFPLLLTRMPAPLKSVLIDFLSSTFDCRISPLYLGTRTLIRSWERWIEESGVDSGRALNKDVALTLGFHLEPDPTTTAPGIYIDTTRVKSPAPDEQQKIQKPMALGLKTLDVVVPAEEVRRFLRVGRSINVSTNTDNNANNGKGKGKESRKRPADNTDTNTTARENERLRRRKLGGGKDEEGWTWLPQGQQEDHQQQDESDNGITETETSTFPQPFTNALAKYLDHHLALDVTHPGVRVLRVVCDAFALSETRMKVFPPRGGGGDDEANAVDTFLRNLIRRAQGREWSDGALRLANLRVIA
ncbi:kinetochore complex Sim4 subunit Fta1-domain-containing protein [Xylaria arbuscula]|nr:kinetochore complex Sim4 subunit Fta1-domain-containing protein [Xylaria arbuscula]